jgi:Protein of unknown function (DUF998)
MEALAMKYLDLCLAAAGVASPIVLATVAMLVSGQRPEYSHLRNTISELGAVGAPGAPWMNVCGILPAGILVMASALAVYRILGAGSLSTIAALILGLGGACLGASALSPWRGPANMDLTILTNRFHFIFAIVGFLAISLSPLLFGLRSRGLPFLHGWLWPSVVASLGVFVIGFWPRQGDYRGAFQRASLLMFYLWLSSLCLWTIAHRLRPSGQFET